MASALTYPKPIVLEPRTAPSASVIFLHGLGDSGDGWSELAPQFQATLQHVRFFFPTAPKRPVTLNMGMAMNAWYDIPSLEAIASKQDSDGLRESQRYVEELIAGEVAKGIPAERIVVGGFSQGGATALMLLRGQSKLAGVIAMSAYLPISDEPGALSAQNKATPILLCHGDADQVVLYKYGRTSAEKLKGMDAHVTFKTYPGMAHSACPAELAEVQAFLAKVLPKQ